MWRVLLAMWVLYAVLAIARLTLSIRHRGLARWLAQPVAPGLSGRLAAARITVLTLLVVIPPALGLVGVDLRRWHHGIANYFRFLVHGDVGTAASSAALLLILPFVAALSARPPAG